MSICVNNLTYQLPNQDTLFSNINFSIGDGQKYAIIGNNGTGKSTLLNVIAGNLRQSEGKIQCGDTFLVPQHFGQFDGMTVAECLHIAEKYHALQRILSGDASESNFEILKDDWTLEERIASAFQKWKISHISVETKMSDLSGGEKTKVFLSGIDIHTPSVVLMDEPTNHLDKESRDNLYRFISEAKFTCLVVSHDRTLLNQFDSLLHMSRQGMRYYPMKYDEFRQIYERECESVARDIVAKQHDLSKAKRMVRETVERQQKHSSRGSKLSDSKGLPRIAKGNLKNNSENTMAKLKKAQNDKLQTINRELDELRCIVPDESQIKIDFSSPNLHTGKILIELKAVNFNYPACKFLWQENLTLTILSGDRIRITGKNGQGKTTLLRLITGEINPTLGVVSLADNLSYVYHDQEYSLIDSNLSVFEQLASETTTLKDHELKIRLHRFLFPQQTWDKKCSALSGGEKMRLAICSLMVREAVPDMIILDEPTNNIDIASMEILAQTLSSYQGTIVVISHDETFIEDIGVTTTFDLNFL